MIAIDHVLVSDEIVSERFVCDLSKCKGGCCVDGDAGAPLASGELQEIDRAIDSVLPYLTEESRRELERQGRYSFDKEFGWVTPTIGGSICVYGISDGNGIVKCGFEQAYRDGKTDWKKPISCHLFPIKTAAGSDGETEYMNYEPRTDLCKAACKLGKKLKVPVYVFLREPIIRKYGPEFYRALEAAAQHLSK